MTPSRSPLGKIVFATCASLALLATAGAASAQPVVPQSAAARPVLTATTPMSERVVVRDATVKLGDLFAGLSARLDEPVAPAPAPGAHAIYDLGQLAALARKHGVSWQPRTWTDRVVIERASQTVGQAEIETALHKALQRQGLSGRAEIEIAGKTPQIHLPRSASAAIDIAQLDYDERSGRFSATAVAGGVRLPLSGRAYALVEVPVLNRRIAAGEIIRQADIEWTAMRSEQVSRQTVADGARIAGQEARRGLNAGQALRVADLRSPLAVTKNAVVTMMLQTPRMQLTSKGKAMEDGSVGDTIRIMNTQSKTIVEGVVTSMNMVQIVSAATMSN